MYYVVLAIVSPIALFLAIHRLRWMAGRCVLWFHKNKRFIAITESEWSHREWERDFGKYSFIVYMVTKARWICDCCGATGVTSINSRDIRGLWTIHQGKLVLDEKRWSQKENSDLSVYYSKDINYNPFGDKKGEKGCESK